jgi:hypothetical protein
MLNAQVKSCSKLVAISKSTQRLQKLAEFMKQFLATDPEARAPV